MWDVKNIGQTKYIPAEPLKQSDTVSGVKFILKLIIDIIKTLVLLVPLTINGLINLLIRKNPKNISGKLALVTGGGNGLGRFICESLAKEGCNVAIMDLDIINAENVAKELRARFGVRSKAYLCDVTDYEKLEKCRDKIKIDLGTVHILVNNAGVVPYVSFREKHWTDVEKILKINLYSHLWTTRVFLQDMINNKNGHIVAISSIVSRINIPNGITYSTSKYGVNGFMGSFAEELWLEGNHKYIKMTTVCPYFINTRKDTMDLVNLRFPALEPVKTANHIVDGIRNDKELVFIPSYLFIANWTRHFPTSVTRLIHDSIFHVRTSRIERGEK